MSAAAAGDSLGSLLRKQAVKARDSARQARETHREAFEGGRALAYYEVVTLMQQQAESFQMPLEALGLQDLDAEGELLA